MITYYEGMDNHGVFHQIEKRVDPVVDGTKLVEDEPVLYDLSTFPEKMSVQEFDKQIIEASIPPEVKDQIDEVIAEANALASVGKADVVAEQNQAAWKRGMYLSWIHSRDITLIMKALGYPKKLEGVHDLGETCKAKYLKQRISSADRWYIDLVTSLPDEQDVVIGFLNPSFSGSLFNWGLKKSGIQNAMDAHRLSDHHLGNPDAPLDLIEKSVNFLNHHIPREHMGIRHEVKGEWRNIEEIMTVDHSTRDNPLLRIISRDVAILYEMLELEGKITPWQLLDPKIKYAIPRKVELNFEESKVLRTIEMKGTVVYDPSTDFWTISGSSGWNLTEYTNGDPLSARIAFFEPLEKNYVLTISPRSYGSSLIVSHQVVHAEIDGFRVLLDTDFDYITSVVGFDFMVTGIKQNPVPDDRLISKAELIEDHHAVENLLAHEAEFGMVTVMCSASIKDLKSLTAEEIRRKRQLDDLHKAIGTTRIDSEIEALKFEIEKTESRIRRIQKMKASSKYWDSAKRFGEMWGKYCTKDQRLRLGGRHVPICTGGGPGIMQAIADGAREQNAQVIGIDCIFGNDNRFDLSNDFSVSSNVRLRCNDFAIRESALINYSHVIIFWPGGYGTSWEAFETLCKIQTDHLRRNKTKVIFVHSEFWMPLYEYICHMVEAGTVNEFNDRIRVPGLDSELSQERYVAEFVSDEVEAFKVAKDHIEFLYQNNELSLK